MFSLRDALQQLNNREFDLKQLREALELIQEEHLGEIPPDVTTTELLLLAIRERLIQEQESGRMKIVA
jgi:hypothetical protein